MFLKGKNGAGEQTLVSVKEIVSVQASGKGVDVDLTTGLTVHLDMGFQSVVNRLKELGADVA